METKFNKKVQKKHRRRLLPDNWQERLPLRPVLFLLGMLLLLFLAVLINQPADSYLNNADCPAPCPRSSSTVPTAARTGPSPGIRWSGR